MVEEVDEDDYSIESPNNQAHFSDQEEDEMGKGVEVGDSKQSSKVAALLVGDGKEYDSSSCFKEFVS